jgi:hypothetical protein
LGPGSVFRIPYSVFRISDRGETSETAGRPGAWWGSVVNPKLALRARGLTNPPTPLGGAGVVNPKIRTVTPGSAFGLDMARLGAAFGDG